MGRQRTAEYVDKNYVRQSLQIWRFSSRSGSISLSIWPPPRAIGVNIPEHFLFRCNEVFEVNHLLRTSYVAVHESAVGPLPT
jgi:hypothetical protein